MARAPDRAALWCGVERRLRSAATVAVALVGAWGLPAAATAASPQEQGRLLFEGRAPLVGKVRGHSTALPLDALRCANCHLTAPKARGDTTRPTQTFGPVLTASHLMEPISRRGAPATRYDLPAFCRLLGSGIDPGEVLLSRSMPLYELSPTQCEALWHFLTRSRP
jgi:hypothetical protein